MTKEFNIALENLYSTFLCYPFKSTIEGCPCCVSDIDKSTLHSKQLRELEDDDLSRYAFKAMTTWGNVEDYKHYLPRILELTAQRKLIVDTFVTLGKLEYGKWKEWDKPEQESIIEFIKAWWKYDINYASSFDLENLVEIHKLFGDVTSMLNEWNLNIETNGFRNYLEFVERHFYELNNHRKSFNSFSQEEVSLCVNWIMFNRGKLEEAFFKFESEDIKFSERISNTLYMLERMKEKPNR